MPYNLKGRNVLVTGGSRGLGELICHKFAEEGCNVAINYLSSAEKAKLLVEKLEKEFGIRAVAIQGDMGVEADCIRTVESAISTLGGLDVIVSNAGYTRFSSFADLSATTSEDWDKMYAVNVKAQSYLLRTALPTFNANAQGGSLIMTNSIAGITTTGSSLPYSVSKAAQLHLMKCLASTQGPKVRVNAVCPGLLLTEWGNLYPPETIKALAEKAKLKTVTDLNDCANIYVDLARNSSITGQHITVDAGLSI